MQKDRKYDYAWEKLFAKYNILDEINNSGIFQISAKQINEFYQARLTTKFDFKNDVPQLFKDNNLNILPLTRGMYQIGMFDPYADFEYESVKPIVVKLPEWIKSLDTNHVTSETLALNIAKATGMVDRVLSNTVDYPIIDAISGRLKSGDLSFQIKGTKDKQYTLNVQNAQVEIDAGFESVDKLALVEAKMIIPKDFIIRQLYFPYRIYKRLAGSKPVIPLYFTYVDGIYNFNQYEFTELNNYSSIKKVKQYSFVVDQQLNLDIDTLMRIAAEEPTLPEDKVPYPQADTFETVLAMLKQLSTPKTRDELTKHFNFDPRQADYYFNVLRYLDLAYAESGVKKLTELGFKISNLPNSNQRNELIIRQILSHKTFKLMFTSFVKNGFVPDDEYFRKVILENVPSIHTLTVVNRRIQTVKSWLKWIMSVVDYH